MTLRTWCTALLVATACAVRVYPVAGQLVYDDPVWVWQDNRDPEAVRTSPSAMVGLQIGFVRVMVTYGRPAVRGRDVYGGLVPYGDLWRAGADEATAVTFTGDVLLEGHAVAAGTYSLFAIPGESSWTIVLNAEANLWGRAEYDPARDVLRLTVPARPSAPTEHLEFRFSEIDSERFSASLVLRWANREVSVRVRDVS